MVENPGGILKAQRSKADGMRLRSKCGEREGVEEINDEESDDTVNGAYRGLIEPLPLGSY